MFARSVCIAIMLSCAPLVWAAPEWSLVSVEAKRFDSMVEPTGEGHAAKPLIYDKTVKPANGKALALITVKTSTQFTLTGGDLIIANDQFQVLGDGQVGTFIGPSSGPGAVRREKVRIFLSKDPFLKEPKTREDVHSWVVEVPKDAKQVTVKIGDKEASGPLPAEATKIDPAEAIDYQIKGIATAASFGKLKAGEGRTLLKASIVMKPKRPSYTAADGKPWFSFSTTSLNVRAGETVAPVIGYLINGEVINPGSYSMGVPHSPNSQFPIEPIFEVPAGTKAATLLWFGYPAGDLK